MSKLDQVAIAESTLARVRKERIQILEQTLETVKVGLKNIETSTITDTLIIKTAIEKIDWALQS